MRLIRIIELISIAVILLALHGTAYGRDSLEQCGDTLDPLPAWDCREVVDEAIGYLRWEGWGQMSYADRVTANEGKPIPILKLRSARDTGIWIRRYSYRYPVRRGWNEEVKLLAWSEKQSVPLFVGDEVSTRYDALFWCSYTDSAGRQRWALMMLSRTESPMTLAGEWDLAFPDISFLMVPSIGRRNPCPGDSVASHPIRIFKRRPTTKDINAFVEDRCCRELKEIRNGFCDRNFFDVDPITGKSPDGRLQFVRGEVRLATWLRFVDEPPTRSFPVMR